MSFENWRVKGGDIHFPEKNKFSSSVRQQYIESLEKIIENLRKENDFTLSTEKHASPVFSLPTIIFCERNMEKDKTKDSYSLVLSCFSDVRVFEKYLEEIRENDEISDYFEAGFEHGRDS